MFGTGFQPSFEQFSILLMHNVIHGDLHAVFMESEDCTQARLHRLQTPLCNQTYAN